MHQTLQDICDSLDSLSEVILKSSNEDMTLNQKHGWNHPAVTRHDLAFIAFDLSSKIKDVNTTELEEDLRNRLSEIPPKIDLIKTSMVPYFYNGHGTTAVPAYLNTMEYIKTELSPIFSWQSMYDTKALPPQLLRKLKSIQSELESLMPDKTEVEKSLKTIREATETIESLPSDIETLKESKMVIEKNEKESNSYFEKISLTFSETEKLLAKINQSDLEASKVVEQCEEAYRITTTKGLAASFELRAIKLNNSMWTWVWLLLISLAIGGIIGASRFESLTTLLKGNNIGTGFIVMEFVLAILSVGAPIWFSWIATKQIGQRFKLAEDYGFKASVAKAYEGYKKEAVRIDEKLEHRLFSSALTRLEEAPLRLMDTETHGSPWQELLDSEQFKKAINNVPEFKNMVFELVKEAIAKSPSKNGESTRSQDVTKEN